LIQSEQCDAASSDQVDRRERPMEGLARRQGKRSNKKRYDEKPVRVGNDKRFHYKTWRVRWQENEKRNHDGSENEQELAPGRSPTGEAWQTRGHEEARDDRCKIEGSPQDTPYRKRIERYGKAGGQEERKTKGGDDTEYARSPLSHDAIFKEMIPA
jgi:hypothetical protein